jgi:subtilisin family serine protease
MRIRSRYRRSALLVALGLVPLAMSGSAWAAASSGHAQAGHVKLFKGTRSKLTAAQVRQLSADAKVRSIIIFKNQLSTLPARGRTASMRAAAARAAQAGVLAELTKVHASHVRGYNIIDAISATVSAAEAKRLASNPAVRAVVPDSFRHFAPLTSGPGPIFPGAARHRGTASPAAQQICPASPAQPLVEPEARTVMNVAAANQIADGSGVKVGIIADGIDPNNADLIRSNGQHVIFDYEDFSGFGTSSPTDGREAFLDAGSIAAQGNLTYDLSHFVNPAHPLPPGCNIKIEGIAPGSSLAVLNVAGPNAGFFNSQIIQAVQWAVTQDHVNVLNESIGANPLPNTQDDPVALADAAAVAAGVTVVSSSGDAGPFNNIGSPATTPGVIAAGGTTTYQVYRQTTRYGTNLVPGGWENNNISALSSSGVTEFNPHTVDVVAPGDRGWSLCSTNTTQFFGCTDIDNGSAPGIWAAGGTSASAPETSATAADVIEAYANAHGGSLPSPALVEQIIVSTATDLGAPADHEGAGLVNTLKAVQLARSVSGGTPTGSTLLVSKTSLNATVSAGSTKSFSVSVTNEGTGTQTVTPTVSGNPTTVSTSSGTVNLSASSPTYIDGEGRTDHYSEQTFTVPAGTTNLNGNITWNAFNIGGAAFETLFDPAGNVAAYSLIGANQSGFGHVEVHGPMAGTWTAVIFTTSAAQYFGPVQFTYFTQKSHSAGTVSPASKTLAPGATGTFTVTVSAGQAGDNALSLHLGTGGATDGAIPIVLRALVPISSAGGSFAGAITGGGAFFNAGQEETYQFNVPSGKSSLNVAIALADHPYSLEGFLVDPSGEPLDVQNTSNDVFQGAGQSMQFFHGSPAPGLWTVTLLTFGQNDGAKLSEAFSGKISFTAPAVTSSGIPNSASTVLPAGHPVTATITVTNNGNSEKDYFADPRLNGQVPQLLLGSDVNAVGLPLSLAAQPNWLIPTNTNALAVAAAGTIPITMDVQADNGDPDFLGVSFGNNSAAALADPEIAPGPFFALPEATGPFGTTAVSGTVNLAAVANTNLFDSAVSPDTGDFWALSVNASEPYSPLVLEPGQTGTITLTFTPSAASGSVVRGFIGVDTVNLGTFAGDELVNIPYTYKVG